MSLLSDFSISLSGMNAAQTQLDAIASNIANANTRGYKPIRVNMLSAPAGGVETGVQSNNSRDPIQQLAAESSGIDLTRASVNLLQAKSLYAANGKLIKAENQMLGNVLDMFDRDHTANDPR
jgi:flagellar hook protein FlgE